MTRLSNIAASLIVGIAVLTLPQQAALAHKSVTKTKTVTTTVTVTKHKHSKKSHARKHPSFKVKTKRAKLKKPKTKRHDHYVKSHKSGHRHRIGSVNHKHGRYLSHTHRQDDFITISPKAKRWPNPKPQAGVVETIRVPSDIVELKSRNGAVFPAEIKLAIVVREKSNGVTIVRNVKEIRASGKAVPADTLIGVTDFPRPAFILNEEELEKCDRRLRTVGESKNVAVKIGTVTYCE